VNTRQSARVVCCLRSCSCVSLFLSMCDPCLSLQ
jgi:hypothetical protein